MRITPKIMVEDFLANTCRSLERMLALQNQMATGKKVARPSDDPVATTRIFNLRSVLAEQAQFQKNMGDAQGWLDFSESILQNVTTTLQRVREITVYGANGTLAPEDRKALATEVNELIDELLQAANATYGGQYIFGGYATTAPPFSRESIELPGPEPITKEVVTYHGDKSQIQWEVARGVTVAVNINGEEAFLVEEDPASGKKISKIFEILLAVRDALSNSEIEKLGGELLEKISRCLDYTLSTRASLGARSNRLQLAQNRFFEGEIKLREILSRKEDVDLAEATTQFKLQEYAYQATLATGARVIPPSLIQFLV